MTFVISDLHGCPLEQLQKLLDKAEFTVNDTCFVLGDAIDRGEYGVELLRYIISQRNFRFILGNHEDFMIKSRFVFDEITEGNLSNLTTVKMSAYDNWMTNGGTTTLDSLERLNRVNSELVQSIFDFLEKAPLYETVKVGEKEFILTHGGLGNFSKKKALEDYTAKELLWDRPSLKQEYFEDKTVIFGHTPTVFYGREYGGKAIKTKYFINIDAGVACGFSPMMLRLDDLKEIYL